MASLRRAVSLNAIAVARLQSRSLVSRARPLSAYRSQVRDYTSTTGRRQQAFHSQLESIPNAADLLSSQKAAAPTNPQTLTEKIVQRWPVAKKFMDIGASKINNNRQVVMTLDHDIQTKTEANLKKYRQIEEFAGTHGVDFYGAGRGIGHQIMVEEGYAWPGTVTVASDSHSNHYGGIGACGTAVVRTDAAAIWATSKTWWQIPPMAKITLTGVMPAGVTGKDVIVALCGLFNQDEVLNHAIEFAGSAQTMASIPIDQRCSISNMTTEWGALTGLFPVDDTLIAWYRAKATTGAMYGSPSQERINHKRIDDLVANPMAADPGAVYAKELYLNLSTLSPFVAGPNSVKVVNPIASLEPQDILIDKAYLVSCTNSRASDLAAAARVFREATEKNDGKIVKIADRVKFYIAAASLPEQRAAEEAGDWQILVDAGAQVLPPGCGPCIGLGAGLLEKGEVGISASNRNFKGRMGHKDALAYLASPEVVAASAIQGKIAGPGWYQKPEGVNKVIVGEGSGDHVADKALSIEDALDKIIAQADSMIASAEGAGEQSSAPAAAAEEETLTDILPGFPERIEGEIVFCDADNINTDGIYPGKYTYQDNIDTETMARVCMENYDTDFRTTAKAGDILVTGFNFGCGSSREQAATSILAKQIPLVVAGSFGNIFSRNSINNALMCVEVPRLVARLREEYKDDKDKPLTRRTGWTLLWDVRRSKVVIKEKGGKEWEQKVGELPPNVQEIIARGGLEKWVKAEIGA